MKLEKIDDNSIRCTLSSLDLSSRNLNLRDMTYGSQAAKQLFNEMMQKARVELGFILDNTPLVIEAIPLRVEGFKNSATPGRSGSFSLKLTLLKSVFRSSI